MTPIFVEESGRENDNNKTMIGKCYSLLEDGKYYGERKTRSDRSEMYGNGGYSYSQ